MPAHEWQTFSERCLFKSREPFKFWWTPAISLERLGSSSFTKISRSFKVTRNSTIRYSAYEFLPISVYLCPYLAPFLRYCKCCKGDWLRLWTMAKLAVSETLEPTVTEFGMSDYSGDITPQIKIQTDHPTRDVSANR